MSDPASRLVYQAMGEQLMKNKDEVPFNRMIKKSKDSFINSIKKDSEKELDDKDLTLYNELTFMIMIHLLYEDDGNLDRIEKYIIESLRLQKKNSISKEQSAQIRMMMTNRITAQQIVEFINRFNISKSRIIRSIEAVEFHLEINTKYAEGFNNLFDILT